jgi:hypothetical protein
VRRKAYADRHAVLGHGAYGAQPPVRRSRARLQLARNLAVQRGDGDVDRGQFAAAMGAIRSRSRSTPLDLVTSENGCPTSCINSMTLRVSLSSRSIGW